MIKEFILNENITAEQIETVFKLFQHAFFKTHKVFDIFCQGLLQDVFLILGADGAEQPLVSYYYNPQNGFQTSTNSIAQVVVELRLTQFDKAEYHGIDSLVNHLHQDKYTDVKFFAHQVGLHFPNLRGFIICKFNRYVFDSIPKIERSSTATDENHFPEFLYFILKNRLLVDLIDLQEKTKNAALLSEREILEHAAQWFLDRWASEILNRDLFGLYSHIEFLSRQMYETKSSRGRIIFARENPDQLVFQDPCPILNYKKARKLLETTQPPFSLLSNGKELVGLTSFQEFPHKNVSGLGIEFIDQQRWSVLSISQGVMVKIFDVSFGYPSFVDIPREEAKFATLMKAKQPQLPPEQFNKLIVIFSEVRNLHCGAVVIFDKFADEESERLKTRGTRVLKRHADANLLRAMCQVDGAILIDFEGNVHSFGVILDGITSINSSDSSRGSRYNSTAAYINGRADLAVGCVFSVDGFVDVFPR